MRIFTLCSYAVAMVITLSACSPKFEHTLQFNPHQPIRVAVLPFAQLDAEEMFTEEDENLLVDDIPLVFSEVENSPPALVRKLVYAELSRTALDVVSPTLIDIELPHRGFAHSDGRFDIQKIYSTNPKVFCDAWLDCDAVLLGVIRKWDRSYYGVQSAHEIDVELRLVAAHSGAVLYQARASDSESRGLTKGPTGYSSIVLEPIRGLDSEIIEDLARRTIAQMLEPLRVQNRPELSETPPPAIYAVSHDANDGALRHGSPLLVVAFASEGMRAEFSIGSVVRGVPMLENSPGHYLGEYWPLPGESFAEQPLLVRMTDRFGRSTEIPVDTGSVQLRPSVKKSKQL